MSAFETLLLNFLKNEVKNNAPLAASLLKHLLDQWKLDPSIEKDLLQVVADVLPTILSKL